MATTTNYGWDTPDDTDLVKDGAAAIRTLGSSADTTVKNLNPGTTAGDIDYYTSGTAKARIAIGTAGQVLQVNSGATAPEWAAPGGAALVFITSASPSAASAVNINDCFTSTYQNYVIYFNLIGTTATANLSFRLRNGGSDRTTSDYDYFGQSILSDGTTGAWFGAAGTLWYPNKIFSTRTTGNIQIFNPKETSITTGNSQSVNAAATDRFITMGFTYSASTSNDGFSLFPDAGTFTGEVRVYGIANSQEME